MLSTVRTTEQAEQQRILQNTGFQISVQEINFLFKSAGNHFRFQGWQTCIFSVIL